MTWFTATNSDLLKFHVENECKFSFSFAVVPSVNNYIELIMPLDNFYVTTKI